MGRSIRRVVTGIDERGKAVVISDGPSPNTFEPPNRPGVQINNMWRHHEAPADLAGNEEQVPTGEKVALTPPANGAVFRVIEFSPEAGWIDQVDRAAAKDSFKEFGAENAAVDDDKPLHPLMHATETIDYSICLEGEIYMVMDDSEVLIKAGDVVVQRGTNHAWSNRSDKPCFMAFILIDGKFPE